MKIVLFSDLHLDHGFAWMSAGARDLAAARRRRNALRQTLQRLVQLAVQQHADALLCGGDLYEHDRFTPDTVQFVRATFADAAPLPIFLAPGNHDWFGPQSLYAQVEWPANVHVFSTPRLQPVSLTDGLTLWGAAHCAPANTPDFLEGFHVDRGGVHIALFHGAEIGTLALQGGEKKPHAPFQAEEIPRAGLAHAFLGHYHRPTDAPTHTYPGNPDPLSFGEDGPLPRGAVLATIAPDGTVVRQRHPVASYRAFERRVDITGCLSQQQVRERVAAHVQDETGVARIILEGTLADSVDLRLADLAEAVPHLEAAVFHLGRLEAEQDFATLAREPTVRGRFVQDVQASGLPAADTQAILRTGLRALAGRSDLDLS